MANLYEINADLMRLWDAAVDPETGELDANKLEAFEALQLEKDQKVENIALWIKNLKSDAEAIKAEAKALTERAQAATNKAERLTRYLQDALNGEKFKTPRVSISYRTSSSVEIVDPVKVPVEYIRVKEPEFDKTAIKAAFKDGKEVPGCGLVAKSSMQIR